MVNSLNTGLQTPRSCIYSKMYATLLSVVFQGLTPNFQRDGRKIRPLPDLQNIQDAMKEYLV